MSEHVCDDCGSSYPEDHVRCPVCRAPRGGFSSTSGGLARMDDELAREQASATHAMMDQSDALLTRVMERDIGGSLALAELGGELMRADVERGPSLDALDALVAGQGGGAEIEGIVLTRLFDRSGDDVRVLKRGLAFMRHKKWAEASEWWSLQREAHAERPRFELLVRLFELWTYDLSGQRALAEQTRELIRQHPVAREMQAQSKRSER
jgi:hypothetical protein